MSTIALNRKIALGFAGMALAALALAGCSGSSSTGSVGGSTGGSAPATTAASGGGSSAADGNTLKTAATTLGTVVVDSSGMTVYYWAKDTKGEMSTTCTAACAQAWPPVTTTSSTPTLSGVTGTVGTIAGPNGTMQVTLNGLPLYTFQGDKKPGDVTGQGSPAFGAPWWVVGPDGSEVTTMPNNSGSIPGY